MTPGTDPEAERLRLRALAFDQSYQLTAVLDSDGVIVDVNDGLEQRGWRRDAVVGRSIVEVSSAVPDGAERSAEWVKRLEIAQHTSGPARYTNTRTETGPEELRSVDCTVTPVRDADGALDAIIVEIHDNTDRYLAETDLQLVEQSFRGLAESLPQMVWVADADGQAEYFSPRWSTFTGRPLGQLLGRGFVDLIHPDDRGVADQEAVPEPAAVFRMRRHDGAYRWIETHAADICDADGVVVRRVGGALDVTDRRDADDRARELQEQLRAALSVSALAGYTYYIREQRMTVDDRLSEIIGMDAGLLMAEEGLEGFMARIHPDDMPRVAAGIEAAINGGPDYDEEYRMVRQTPRGPEQRWVIARGRVEFDAEGAVRMLGVIEDITDRRQEESGRVRLAKLEALGTLASGIAHDFNNVISAILSNAEVAETELRAGESPQTSIAEIGRGARRAADIVQRLLTFSREEAPRREPFNLAEVTAEACALVRPALPPGVSLDVSAPPSGAVMLGDPGELHQVVVNLVTNAGQAIGSERGRIGVALHRVSVSESTAATAPLAVPAGEYLCLTVRDDGPGIPEALIPRLFDPFFTTKPAGEGSGLGLAGAQSVVHHHGGTLSVQSHVGVGTTFTAYLPVHAAPTEVAEPTVAPAAATPAVDAPKPTPAHAASGPLPTVLFVDDEHALVRLAERAFPYSGLAVVGFTDPQAALEAFTSDPAAVDVLVTDLSMPVMTGLSLIEAARAVRPDLPTVLTSGYLSPSTEAEAQRYGVDAIVPKPCSATDLAAAVMPLVSAPGDAQAGSDG